jgi:outer membrane protein TolC
VLNAETQVLAARQSMVDILTPQAVARVTVLLAVGGSFDPRASGGVADAHTASNFSDPLTRVSP